MKASFKVCIEAKVGVRVEAGKSLTLSAINVNRDGDTSSDNMDVRLRGISIPKCLLGRPVGACRHAHP